MYYKQQLFTDSYNTYILSIACLENGKYKYHTSSFQKYVAMSKLQCDVRQSFLSISLFMSWTIIVGYNIT